jgi:hypothetical protein
MPLLFLPPELRLAKHIAVLSTPPHPQHWLGMQLNTLSSEQGLSVVKWMMWY